jgi:hypothetical protein
LIAALGALRDVWVFDHIAAINAQRARWLTTAGTDGELLHAVVERQVAQSIAPVSSRPVTNGA